MATAKDTKGDDKGLMSPEDIAQARSIREHLGVEGNRIKYATNIDTSKREGKVLIMRCTDTPDHLGESLLGQIIGITHYVVHNAQLVSQGTGDVVDSARTVLVLEDGSTVAFVSDGILDSLQMIIGIDGNGPWNPPLQVYVKQVRTRSGFRVYKLIYPE